MLLVTAHIDKIALGLAHAYTTPVTAKGAGATIRAGPIIREHEHLARAPWFSINRVIGADHIWVRAKGICITNWAVICDFIGWQNWVIGLDTTFEKKPVIIASNGCDVIFTH